MLALTINEPVTFLFYTTSNLFLLTITATQQVTIAHVVGSHSIPSSIPGSEWVVRTRWHYRWPHPLKNWSGIASSDDIHPSSSHQQNHRYCPQYGYLP